MSAAVCLVAALAARAMVSNNATASEMPARISPERCTSFPLQCASLASRAAMSALTDA